MAWASPARSAQIPFRGASCEVILGLQQSIREKLGYEPDFKIEKQKSLDQEQDVKRYVIMASRPEYGTPLADVDFSVYDSGKTIYIEKIEVYNANNKHKGLSIALFAKMVLYVPMVERVIVDLALDNLQIFEKALKSTDDCFQGLRQTPMYKTAAHFGFSNVISGCDLKSKNYSFVLGLEPAH
jgi:hypothetical protein